MMRRVPPMKSLFFGFLVFSGESIINHKSYALRLDILIRKKKGLMIFFSSFRLHGLVWLILCLFQKPNLNIYNCNTIKMVLQMFVHDCPLVTKYTKSSFLTVFLLFTISQITYVLLMANRYNAISQYIKKEESGNYLPVNPL